MLTFHFACPYTQHRYPIVVKYLVTERGRERHSHASVPNLMRNKNNRKFYANETLFFTSKARKIVTIDTGLFPLDAKGVLAWSRKPSPCRRLAGFTLIKCNGHNMLNLLGHASTHHAPVDKQQWLSFLGLGSHHLKPWFHMQIMPCKDRIIPQRQCKKLSV